tara:strand:- start:171 stop:1109 length:939 start_codon:yes stop_codon:yes gene_type:complete
MNILITGGCGYVGSKLIKYLLNKNHKIVNIDTQWFGKNLKNHKNLKNIKLDIRDLKTNLFKGIDCIIHLANIANDPAVELNPNLSWEVNVLSAKKLIEMAIKNKVKKFIYASSGSVYGVKKERKVTEDLELLPISTYNKTKMIAERVFMSYKDKIIVNCVRPATVCGLSERMRYDVSVNLLTLQAIKKNKINVFGGNQTRPNIHINDLVRLYDFFLKKNIKSGFYNAGFENLKIIKIAKIIQLKTGAKIKISKSNDPRSYRQDSSKILRMGFERKYSVKDAINDIIKLNKHKKINDQPINYTVKWMKKLNIS